MYLNFRKKHFLLVNSRFTSTNQEMIIKEYLL